MPRVKNAPSKKPANNSDKRFDETLRRMLDTPPQPRPSHPVKTKRKP